MNYSTPILVCDENEEFRILIRDMLTKNGFFHIFETANSKEAMDLLSEKKDFFVLVEAKALNTEMYEGLKTAKSFIVFAESNARDTLALTAKLGVEHVMSYPLHSKKLLKKIETLL